MTNSDNNRKLYRKHNQNEEDGEIPIKHSRPIFSVPPHITKMHGSDRDSKLCLSPETLC